MTTFVSAALIHQLQSGNTTDVEYGMSSVCFNYRFVFKCMIDHSFKPCWNRVSCTFFFSIERTLLHRVVQIDAVLESCVSFVMIMMNLQSSIITRTFYLLC